jgi:hypothetical protein
LPRSLDAAGLFRDPLCLLTFSAPDYSLRPSYLTAGGSGAVFIVGSQAVDMAVMVGAYNRSSPPEHAPL